MLLLGWILAFSMKLPSHYLMLVVGGAIFFLVFLPLVIIKRKRHREKMAEIIRKYREKGEQPVPTVQENSKRKGWSMNDSPFRERRSGVTWGGGNIHAANATRGTRKK